MRLQPFFTFYGGKWRIARRYPPPTHPTIIEPFAGAAGYALTYYDRRVVLNEANARIAALWRWLVRVTAVELLSLPDVPHDGTVDDLGVHQEARDLIGFWCNKSCALPATRPSSWMRSGRYANQFWGPAIRERLARQAGAISHWVIREGSYLKLELERASWFVDPPYQVPADTPKRCFPAGARYSPSARKINFEHLGRWCRALPGQVIVCEHPRATWLPFESLTVAKGLRRESAEAVWIRDDEAVAPGLRPG